MSLRGKARVGNWQEELVYEADRKALRENARASGGTLSQQIFAKSKHHRQPVDLGALATDGLLRFNSPIMLQNADTQCFLSVDADDKTQVGSEWKIACTTAPAKEPVLRNSWALVPVASADDEYWASKGESDLVHYGQRFMLQSMPELFPAKPAYLCSEAKSSTSFSKTSKNNEVYFSAKGGQKGLWCFVYAHPEFRFELEGQPVKANAVVLLQHQLTNTPVASSIKSRYGNDFGMEFEVCGHKFLSIQSKKGNVPEQPSNLWACVTAPGADDASLIAHNQTQQSDKNASASGDAAAAAGTDGEKE